MNDNSILIGRPREVFDRCTLPCILPFTTSWQIVEDSNLSLARIGDGEVLNAVGRPCGFENGSDKTLANAMVEILSNPFDNLLVGINRAHFYSTENTLPTIDNYCRGFWSRIENRDYLVSKMTQTLYLDACLTIPRHHYVMPEVFWSEYFSRIAKFMSKTRVMLVTGDEDAVSFYKAFARDFRVIPCAKRGAWAERERIVSDLRRLNSDASWTVVAVCGPTATWLAYDLCGEMRVLDLGHLSREYQYWKKGSNPTRDSGVFFGS